MRRAHLPRWPQAVTCPNSMFDLPSTLSRDVGGIAAPDRTAPVAVPDPSPSGLTPGRGGTNLHPY